VGERGSSRPCRPKPALWLGPSAPAARQAHRRAESPGQRPAHDSGRQPGAPHGARASSRGVEQGPGHSHAGQPRVAGARRPAPEPPRRGPSPLADAGCRPPGVGDLQPAAGRGLGGRRLAQPGSWHPAGPTDRLGEPGSGARRAVYEHPGGRAGPSGPPTRLCALAPCRTGPQSRLDRVYASGAHESEGHGQTAYAMATTLGPHS
jgi:hypothetical protein